MGAKPTSTSLGQQVRARRKVAGLSQEDLALLAGWDRSYLSRFERGEVSPTIDKTASLVSVLNIVLEIYPSTLLAHRQSAIAPARKSPLQIGSEVDQVADAGAGRSRGDELIKRVLQEESDDELRGQLFREFNSGYPVRQLQLLLSSQDDHIVATAMWVASRLGKKARPILARITTNLHHRSSQVRILALDCLRACAAPKDQQAIRDGLELINDSDSAVASRAMLFLAAASVAMLRAAHIAESGGKQTPAFRRVSQRLFDLATSVDARKMASALASRDQVFRRYAAAAVARQAHRYPEILTKASGSGDQAVKRFALEMIARAEGALVRHQPAEDYARETPVGHSIGEVVLVVRDYDEAIDFYVGRLGFSLIEDTVIDSQGGRRVLLAPRDLNSCYLLLVLAVGDQQSSRIGNQTGGGVFSSLRTKDVWLDVESFKSKGVEFVQDPVEETFGTAAVFKDLYGSLWRLLQLK